MAVQQHYTIEFEIDAEGNLQYHIQGIKGKGCDDIVAKCSEIIGKPSSVENTAEYGQAVGPGPVIRVGR